MTRRAWVAQRVDAVIDCMLMKEGLQFGKFFWVLHCQVNCLREVFGNVVQLPHFLGSIKLETLQSDPRQSTMEARSHPTICINGSIAKNLKILTRVGAWCISGIKRIRHRCAV